MTDRDHSWRPDMIADLAEHRRRTEALLWHLDALGLSARDRVPISAGVERLRSTDNELGRLVAVLEDVVRDARGRRPR